MKSTLYLEWSNESDETNLSGSDGPQRVDELELGFFGRRFVDVSATLLHHFGDGGFELAAPFAQCDYVLVEQVPLLCSIADLNDGFQNPARRYGVGTLQNAKKKS